MILPTKRAFTAEKGSGIWAPYLEARRRAADWNLEAERRAQADSRFLDFVRRHLPPTVKPRILEIGCGTAVNLFQISSFANGVGFGLDITPETVAIQRGFAAHFGRTIHFVCADALRLPYASGVMDIIYSRGVLEHHPDPLPAIAEQVRVLKPGGLLIIGVPQLYNPYTLVKNILILLNRWPWGWETQFSLSALRRIATAFSLEYLAADGDGYSRGRDLGLGRARQLAFQADDGRFGAINARLARWLDQRFTALEARYPFVIFHEVLVAFLKLRDKPAS